MTNVPDLRSTEFISFLSTISIVAVGAGSVMRYSPLYAVDEYNSRYVPRFDAGRFAMMSVGKTVTVKVGSEERERA